MNEIERVLSFWFGPPGSPPDANASKWFTKDDGFDREIRDTFGATLEATARGEHQDWKETPRGRLARVIVLDQFSRNVYRNTERSFAQDGLAVETTLDAIANGDEGVLSLVERQFLYMPLMHAENVDLQRKCVAAFARLRDRATPPLEPMMANCLQYAQAHADIVERFGRFPHRNAILGRTSTGEEIEFLKQPNSSF